MMSDHTTALYAIYGVPIDNLGFRCLKMLQ